MLLLELDVVLSATFHRVCTNCFVVWLTDERRLALFQPGPLSEILTIANLRDTQRA